MVNIQGPILMEAAQRLAVVVAKRLSLSTYKGVALSTRNSTSFTIDPPLQAAANLKAWIDSRSHTELQELIVDQSITISQKMVDEGSVDIYTLAQLETLTKPGEYWVRAYLQISDEEQKLYYFGCSKCCAKISANEEGIEYTCHRCKKNIVTAPRPLVLMSAFDENTYVKVVAIEHVAERILQTTAERIYSISKLGQDYDLDEIKADFEGKVFQMCLRRTFGEQNENQRKMILVSYKKDKDFADSSLAQSKNKISVTQSAGKGKLVENSQCPLSPLKRQMSEIQLDGMKSPAKKSLTFKNDAYEGGEGNSSQN